MNTNRRFDPELLADRARELELRSLTGMRLVFVELPSATQARLLLEFHNDLALADLHAAVNGGPLAPTDVFSISGGVRVRGGSGPGQVQVESVSHVGSRQLELLVAPIGDYSTYTLHARFDGASGEPRIDPLFATIDFKFRPGCFNLECAPRGNDTEPLPSAPDVDYLAKDYHSFKHLLINAMRVRVPGWEPTSEADLDQVILDLLAADGDELSDFQDRVMNEAYLGLARKRVSLARHARLLDYHIHQGNQAGTWLVVEASVDDILPAGFGVFDGASWQEAQAIFVTSAPQACLANLSALSLYTWGGALLSLDAGATEADLALPAPLDASVEADADALRDQLRRSDVNRLVIEEQYNPSTGTANGRDLRKRQLLELLPGDAAAETQFDPSLGQYFVRVRWRAEDRLRARYCFVTRCASRPPITDVSVFHGNVVFATHGRPHRTVFRPQGAALAPTDPAPFVHYDEQHHESSAWGALCALPNAPLAYQRTAAGGETPTRTTLAVGVSGFAQPWLEQSDLIESRGDDEHFIVETDELRQSRIRFGNGVNSRALAPDAVVTCDYQLGGGSVGNVGADTLTGFLAGVPGIESVRNPFDVSDGRDWEPADVIVRRVPEAYRHKQLRAVTLQDYVRRAEELDVVSHAAARYAWTGSWRTVQIAIDPAGTTQLHESVREQVHRHLDAVRLIGEDLEVRPAQYIPLDIELGVCIAPGYWPRDLEFELGAEFSDGFTRDGRQGFFHPDSWTFGQTLHASQIIGRALSVKGVERVVSLRIRRFNPATGATSVISVTPEQLAGGQHDAIVFAPFEILQVASDPSQLEKGRMLLSLQGGRA